MTDDDFDWDKLAEATVAAYPSYQSPRRIMWEPTPDEIELAKDRGCVWCTECQDPIEIHDRHGCKACKSCPVAYTDGQIGKVRKAHELRWVR